MKTNNNLNTFSLFLFIIFTLIIILLDTLTVLGKILFIVCMFFGFKYALKEK